MVKLPEPQAILFPAFCQAFGGFVTAQSLNGQPEILTSALTRMTYFITDRKGNRGLHRIKCICIRAIFRETSQLNRIHPSARRVRIIYDRYFVRPNLTSPCLLGCHFRVVGGSQ
jgi:hypothetical protein